MDDVRFDALSRALTASRSRRATLYALLGILLGDVVPGPSPASLAAAGKRNGKATGKQSGNSNNGRDRRAGKSKKDRGQDRRTGRAQPAGQRRRSDPPDAAAQSETRDAGDDAVSIASHGCRHAGAACTKPGQCCTGKCLSGDVCSCNATNPCPKPPICKKYVCSPKGRCTLQNKAMDSKCAGCCSAGVCKGGTSNAFCGADGDACVACGAGRQCVAGSCNCTTTSCAGCCADNECKTGTTDAVCGSGGETCENCTTSVGTCCGGECCDGCCSNDECKTGDTNQFCGTGGETCVECTSGQTCSGGGCTCTTTSCPGCCNGDICRDGTTDALCGSGGEICEDCTTSGGKCCGGACCDGCCDNNECKNGDTDAFCGTGGVTCDQCDDGQTCSGGRCICTAASCQSGCCKGDHCRGGNADDACGTGGGTCDECGSNQFCHNGVCELKCGAGGTCRVFATSTRQNGNLGGLSGADQICNDLATAADLPGTYMAWLSDGSGGAADEPLDRFTQSTGPYLLVNGTKIADNWVDLTDSDLDNAINRDETGALINSSLPNAWTNTDFTGVEPFGEAADCGNWTSGSGENPEVGNSGSILETGPEWSHGAGSFGCSFELHLYCFQQD